MRLKLEINLDDPTFDKNAGLEVAQLLSALAHKAEYAGHDILDPLWRCVLVPEGGPPVGYAEVLA
jgi:hypothetical protein